MGGKAIRLGRLYDPESGRSLVLPVDHGLNLGAVSGLEDPRRLLERLEGLGVDATLISPGMARAHADLFTRRTAPARVLTIDLPLLSNVPGAMSEVRAYSLIASVQDALRMGVECVKVLLVWGIEPSVQMANLHAVAQLARECEVSEMPLMVEPVLWGESIAEEQRADPALVANAVRIAVELGADVIKGPYVADTEALATIVRRTPVPIMLLGGPRLDDARAVLQIAANAMAAGVRGIVFGRNVFQRPDAEAMIRALRGIVHEHVSVDVAAAALRQVVGV
jgi:class I fructose-bisphosphate aldolase